MRPRSASTRCRPRSATTPVSDSASTSRRPRRAAFVGPRSLVIGRGRATNEPSIEQAFAVIPGAAPGTRIEHLVYGAGATLDTRRGAPHWSHGWLLDLDAQRFDVPVRALA